jgi:hypothetical protein
MIGTDVKPRPPKQEFSQEQLPKVKQNLEFAENSFREFASKNKTLTSVEIDFWPHAWRR